MSLRPALLLLALVLGSASAREAPAPLVAWSALAGAPGTHLGEVRRVFVQFHSIEEGWNPFLTRFGPAAFLAVRAWTDEQRPWLQEQYESPAVRVFARRGGDLERSFRGAQPHQRFELVIAVREHCAGELWSEVLSARRLEKEIPEGSVLHAARALERIEEGSWELAVDDIDRALAAPLPQTARDELLALRERALARVR